ncbi:O-antigen ligase family protein [Phyllobacterium leguminum]|uniref:O-antigen ligase n=1 Tax=Phyllobacterium leguminum TaxID=314237 RepID=A0A318T4S1_9HYPH|nr:O-antigen ligase family protein [Phyllobacterium leguminum]PYE85334.1 O-antigen ligase [Phyllobacterium leguminum]
MILRKSFLVRRRVDPWVLGVGAAMMPVRIGLGPIVLFVFACIGIYLTCGRHRTTRLFARNFYICAVLYGIWSLGLIFVRGEPIMDNRQVGYTLLFTIFAFAGPGMVLMRDPLKAFVVGSRVGTVLAFLATLTLVILYGGRIGVGGNPAVFAFVAGLAAIGATIPIRGAPRYLPNGPWWLILCSVVILASGTRAVLVVLPVFALVEMLIWLQRFTLKTRMISYVAIVFAAYGIVSFNLVDRIGHSRFASIIEYHETADAGKAESQASADAQPSADAGKGGGEPPVAVPPVTARLQSSAETRLVMWEGAKQVILEHPLIGVGSYAKMDAVRAKAGENAPLLDGYRHVHNAVLDELLNGGVIGLVLLFACAYFALSHLFRHSDCFAMTRAIIYFIIACTAYGMLHNPLLHEVTISGIFFFLGALNAAVSRSAMAERRGVSVNTAGAKG